jgi:hypothetical protein
LWGDREQLVWNDEPFVMDRVPSVFHIPLNLGKHVVADQARIDAAGAAPAEPLMLCDHSSSFATDLFIHVTKPVPGAKMAHLSGTFLTKVFEGPYSDVGRWAKEMAAFVAARGNEIEKLYFAYTTCPACAKAYGKNYVIGFALVKPAGPGAA